MKESKYLSTLLESGMIDNIVDKCVNHLTDAHFKVVSNALNCIGLLIVTFTSLLQNSLETIIPKVLYNISDRKEKVANAANYVLELLHTNYEADSLIAPFIRCLDSSHMMRIKTGALEVMNVLIKE